MINPSIIFLNIHDIGTLQQNIFMYIWFYAINYPSLGSTPIPLGFVIFSLNKIVL